MTQSPVRPPRADAIRNRAKILLAARQQITEHGPDVGMDDIARSAGVAVGTLYRHFPTKTDLVAAAVSAFVVQVADYAEAAVSRVDKDHPAFGELTTLLRDIVQASVTNHAVKAAADVLNAKVDDSHDVLRASGAIQTLVDAAATAGAVRKDLCLDDFYLLVSNAPVDEPPAALDRWVDLILYGIVGQTPG